ncbi:tRNA pseudouridine(55) synthase TruB [Rosettibacter firmus]|uniref:tRNA pseudouridine(55) synthase TruB n=1 Tax=Rosettibacter firmus TaxID=3111522 RepID=UPI00336BF54C
MKVITKKISNDYVPNFQEGEIILINKPLKKTSFDVVHKIRKAVNVKKVGHAGTLDPMATGLLIVCTGKKTKEITTLSKLNKTYSGIISLGKTTPSFDLETDFDSEKDFDYVTEDMIYKVRDTFLGLIEQIPPMYSAIKKNGKALYKLARKGIEVEREPRKIFIYKFDINKIDLPDIYFEITCSSGTYIRVIAKDFGDKLGCGAYLKALRRTQIGDYCIEDAFEINEFFDYLKSLSFSVN